jgi:hypothetical protein
MARHTFVADGVKALGGWGDRHPACFQGCCFVSSLHSHCRTTNLNTHPLLHLPCNAGSWTLHVHQPLSVPSGAQQWVWLASHDWRPQQRGRSRCVCVRGRVVWEGVCVRLFCEAVHAMRHTWDAAARLHCSSEAQRPTRARSNHSKHVCGCCWYRC